LTDNRKTILYGLGSCGTCRKARGALESAGHWVEFRDVRDAPLSEEERRRFLVAFGDRLVNRASTTWRGLTDAERQESPERLLAAHPALMKRPVVAVADDLWIGWDAATQAAVLK